MPKKVKKKLFQKEIQTKNELKKRSKKRKITIFILLFFVIFFGILVGVSLAKYETQMQIKAFANIAKPILEVETQKSILITALAPKAAYVFEVRNYKEEEVSQVDMEYYIEIVAPHEDSIQFSLYQGETPIPLTNDKTNKIKLGKEEKQVHSYRLEITYDKTKQTTNEKIEGNIEIKIHSIQKA